MLISSNEKNNSSDEVDVSTPMYKLVDRAVLRTLMKRTGDGQPITIRGLADAAGIQHHSTIGHLLTGEQEAVPFEIAEAIASRIGVDLLVLWVPVGRAVRSSQPPAAVAV
ncbi:helix-turn-helix domain-containing protein [Streptomyces sp. NPDC087525]|uniref:helix-turn-helix domain-containing protein n=1 Tax=unclassified Streptomyces TaxID=2593676 RepID=UPI00382CD9D0